METGLGGSSTFFAPAERSEPKSLALLAESIVADPVMQAVLQATGGLLMVLDEHRQLLAGNQELLGTLGLKSGAPLLGQRPGEALGCIHAQTGPGGCGTSMHCQHCGAVLAILSAQATQQATNGECTLASRQGERVACSQYQIKVTPLALAQETVLVCALHDISGVRRRELLEMIFLHDTRNLLAGLQGWSEELHEERTSEASHNMRRLVDQLMREVESQDVLLRAEAGYLRARCHAMPVNGVFDAIADKFHGHPCCRDRDLRIERVADSEVMTTDKGLLVRVLANMVTNALEASPAGSEVRVWFQRSLVGSIFHVHNPGVIPPSVAARIFQPYFSSKGRNRGFGTYAMRLLGEHCLGGRVSFVTDAVTGTRFSVELPS
jgi:signal transduction histidine kinase